MRMTAETRAKIEANHALASALQMLIGFEDRPEAFGPVPSLEDQITQLADSYKVDRKALVAEYVRLTGLTMVDGTNTASTFPAVQAVCKRFMDRSAELEYKGKKRDSAALEYVVGAAVGAELAGNAGLSQHLCHIIFLAAVRGYSELVHTASM